MLEPGYWGCGRGRVRLPKASKCASPDFPHSVGAVAPSAPSCLVIITWFSFRQKVGD